MTNPCLFTETVSNAGVFAQMFNQLVQDGAIDRIVFTYEKELTQPSANDRKTVILWRASLHIKVIAIDRRYIIFGPLCTSRHDAKRMVLVEAAHLLPTLSREAETILTYKKRPVGIFNNEGSVHFCQ